MLRRLWRGSRAPRMAMVGGGVPARESVLPTLDKDGEWSNQTRQAIARLVHSYYQRFPDAQPIAQVARFATQGGFAVSSADPRIEEYLHEFIDHPENALRDYEARAAIDLLLDGELALLWEETKAGASVVRPIRPVDIVGIETEPGFYRRLRLFRVREAAVTGVGERVSIPVKRLHEYDAADVTFAAINNRAYEIRGRTALLPALDWLAAREEWMQDRSIINKVRGYILLMVRAASASKTEFDALAAKFATAPKTGSAAVVSDKVEIDTVVPQIRANDAAEDGRQLRLMVGTAMNLPSYFFADGYNNSLATATRQQLPALMVFEEYQKALISKLWQPLFSKAIARAVSRGQLPETVQIDGKAVASARAFVVSYRSVIETDQHQLTETLVKQLDAGLISRRMAIAELGYDAEAVLAEIDSEEGGNEPG